MRESACQGSLRRRRHVNLHTDQMINWRLSSREATIDQSPGKWPAANGTERMQSHTGCICLTFPHGGFWKSSMEVTINQSPGKWQMANDQPLNKPLLHTIFSLGCCLLNLGPFWYWPEKWTNYLCLPKLFWPSCCLTRLYLGIEGRTELLASETFLWQTGEGSRNRCLN